MRHTDDEIEKAAERFAELADTLDPSAVQADDSSDLRQIAAASEAVRSDEARLREHIAAARRRGRSWNDIGLALGVSRQAARQRFSDSLRA